MCFESDVSFGLEFLILEETEEDDPVESNDVVLLMTSFDHGFLAFFDGVSDVGIVSIISWNG